jgi:ABC-type lipoprotein release transport system permease subunit
VSGPLARQRYLLDYALGSLARRKGRNLSLLGAYALVVFALATVMLHGQALRREAELLLADSPAVIVQKLMAGRHDLVPAAYLDELVGIRGVQSVQGRLWGYYFDPGAGANYTVMVPLGDAPAQGSAIIGAAIARLRGLAPGDFLSLRTHRGEAFPLRIAAVLDHASALVSADLFLVGAEDFRVLFGMPPDRYTDLILGVRNPREAATVAEKVLQRLPDTRPVLREEVLRTYRSVFDWREGLVLLALTGALLAFALLAWDKASGLSAEERRELGILKAIGWDTGDLLRMKLWEGAAVSLSAFLAGYLLAYAYVFWAGAPLVGSTLAGWSVLYPEFRPRPVFDGLQLMTLFSLSVVPYTLATLVPVWKAAITDPDAVMR